MGNKKAVFILAGKAWKARKGGAFKRGLMAHLRIIPNYLKSLLIQSGPSDTIYYAEREFSFDETPIFQFKLQRLAPMRLPCINPAVDCDDDILFCNRGRKDYLCQNERRSEKEKEGHLFSGGGGELTCEVPCEVEGREEETIDSKAEEFIARFYQQMKLQRQVSFEQYNEMLSRSLT